MRVFVRTVLLLAAFSQSAWGQSAPAALADAPVSPEDARQIAMALANCAGVWDAMSEAAASDNKPASAEQFHNIGNGAETAAMWVLASHLAITEKKATTYGSWSELTRPKRESAKTMILALAEQKAEEGITEEAERCNAMLPEQENILQMMRLDRVRKLQGDS